MPSPSGDGFQPAKKQKRISRACLRCRQRKSKCDIDSHCLDGVSSCQRCFQDGVECILGGSNRGGRRVRRSAAPSANTAGQSMSEDLSNPPSLYQSDYISLSTSPQGMDMRAGGTEMLAASNSNMAAAIEDTFASSNLHSTSDALNFLSQAAQKAADEMATDSRSRQGIPSISLAHSTLHGTPSTGHMAGELNCQGQVHQPSSGVSVIPYHLITAGLLSEGQVIDLLSRFTNLYHPHLPIAPRRSLQTFYLADTARHEPHLLTAMITIAAKDLSAGTEVLAICSHYMHQLVSELSAGKRCDVEAVEALLLLGEWEPQSALSNVKDVGCGEEDLAAWMHVGLALRIGYYLRLDRTSFNNDDEERMAQYNRRRLAWAACYIADRQISVRIGRAFWSRGPGPVSGTGVHPSLQPENAGDDDHASIFQATTVLTQLYGNVHDVLYSGMGSGMKMMITGDYVKYIDDFRAAINSWKSVWGTLTCSPNIKITLQMNYEYLRLYNSAYAFQATTFRTLSSKHQDTGDEEGQLGLTGALPDARFIYESVDAAKSLLTLVNNFSHAEISLRHFPMKFSLYCVNSAVFLYKAWSLGILSPQEKTGVRQMIAVTISRLRAGSVRPGDVGSRYAQLLEMLWRLTDKSYGTGDKNLSVPNLNILATGQRQNASPPDDFSWLDLQAVGEFLTGEQDPMDFDFVDGALHHCMQASRRGSMSWNDLGWADNDMDRLF